MLDKILPWAAGIAAGLFFMFVFIMASLDSTRSRNEVKRRAELICSPEEYYIASSGFGKRHVVCIPSGKSFPI